MADRFDELIAALENDTTRDEAIKSLGALKDARAVDPLIRILKAKDARHAMAYRPRQLAAEALGQIADLRAMPALIVALEDTSSSVKISAAQALAMLNDPRCIDSLVILLEDRNLEVRIAGLKAFEVLGKNHTLSLKPIVPLLADPEDSARDEAARVILTQGSSATDILIEALKHPNSTIRGAAANLIGELKDQRASKALIEVYQKDDSSWVQSRAEWAIRQLPTPTIEFLRKNKPQAPDAPPNTLELIRSQSPKEYPSLHPKPQPQNFTPAVDPNDMTAEQVEAMLDSLDVRLANGEISEATYNRLAQRWEERLNQLKNP